MDWTDTTYFALAALGFFLAGVIKGTTGLGYSSCALPFLVSAMGLKTAIIVLVIPAMLSNVLVMFYTGHFRETLLRFWPLYSAMLPGIVIGIAMLVWIDQKVATRTLGILTVLYAVLALTRPALVLGKSLERCLQIPVGLLNGFFTGLTGSQMMPLLPFMLALRLDPDRLVQANNVAVSSASAFLAMALVAAGLMSWPILGFSMAAVVPALVGVMIGTRARRHIPAPAFRMLILALLMIMGIVLTGCATAPPATGRYDPTSPEPPRQSVAASILNILTLPLYIPFKAVVCATTVVFAIPATAVFAITDPEGTGWQRQNVTDGFSSNCGGSWLP